jgi:hypothetical protein
MLKIERIRTVGATRCARAAVAVPARLTLAATLVVTALGAWTQDAWSAPEEHDTSRLVAPGSKLPDHEEFEATLKIPFTSPAGTPGRDLELRFEYPGIGLQHAVGWELVLRDSRGVAVRRMVGETSLLQRPVTRTVHWDGRSDAGALLPAGRYTATLRAVALEARRAAALHVGTGDRLAPMLSDRAAAIETQSWEFLVGPAPRAPMAPFAMLAQGTHSAAADAVAGHLRVLSVPVTSSLPYTVYYANLHSQTNDSDGGGNVATCVDAQPPQSGAYGPSDAYAYAKAGGLDILMTSEHNHLYDGSTGTNANGDASAAIARYQAGLAAASRFNAANPNFLAVYGMEWGVISNGGHMNIFNSSQLFGWEYNSSSQLFGDVYTAKSDYAAIYATMRQKGLVGQFNHPASSGQFVINGTSLAYNADGDQVMVLAEVLNSSAFSSNTSETESSMSNYEPAFNTLLERGFHVAPSSDQDNHCANWGRSYTNRTGILIPTGTALTMNSFIAALQARHVFATMDKTAQVVLTANGHVMGDRFDNSGALALNVGYASTSGHTAATVQVIEGVPGSNGSTDVLASTGAVNITPATGNHFYYAKVTQDDGKILWSAPVWVNQGAAGGSDTTPPTATATESGTSGTITLSATASDNVGVSRVDFLVDGALKGSASSAPYAMSLDSTTLSNASHSLVAKAYDAAGNVGTSAAFAFSVNNSAGGAMNESEPNGSIANANVVGSNTTITGTMGNSTDKDYFKVALAANQSLKVDMTGPVGKDYDLYLVDASGTVLASSEGNTSTESITYKNGTAAKTVYIEVVSYSGSSTTLQYTLKLSHP